MALFFMNKEDKARIFQLLDKGIKIGELEKTSKTPRRTLYRWYKEWKESRESAPPTPLISEAIQESKKQAESQLEIDFSEDWLAVASKQSIKHCIVNGQIAKALSNILITEIQKPDINYRAVTALSGSIAIHSKLHREYGLFYLLDSNKAVELLTSQGYVITDS
jgi:transposase-like protein